MNHGVAIKAHAILELLIGDILRRCGIDRIRQYRTGSIGLHGQQIVVDWFVPDTAAFPRGLYIECKWQQSSGSANKKLVGMPVEIKRCYLKPTLIVLDGKKTKAELEMLKAATGGNFINAMSIPEFIWFTVSTLANECDVLVTGDVYQGELF